MCMIVTRVQSYAISKEINIVNHFRNTGFVGLILDLENYIQIYRTLDNKQLINRSYMLTYKYSQDHLETFFSATQGRSGFYNNPCYFQFEHAYERLIIIY
jgi:DNA transposase THAP9